MDISGGECTLNWVRYGKDRWIGLNAMKFTGMMLRLTIACLIVFAGVAILQDRFIYFPEKAAIEDVVPADFAPGQHLRRSWASWPSRPDLRAPLSSSFMAMRGMPDTVRSTPQRSPGSGCA
jgi:hypothetical protein